MPRDRATIFTAIWSDADWKSLTAEEQRLYFLLNTHPSLSYAGVADWRPGRLAKMCSGTTAADIAATGSALQAKRFVFIDEESEEVLVRSYIRHDGVLNHPKLAISFANAYSGVASPTIQAIITHELARLQGEHPDWRAFSDKRVTSILKQPQTSIDEANGNTPETPKDEPQETPQPKPQGLGQPLEQGLGFGSGQPLGQPLDQPLEFGLPTATATTTSTSVGGSSKSRRSPEHPLPQDWRPTDSHKAKADELGINLAQQAELFRLHAETHDRRVRNWNSAFTQWLIKSQTFSQGANGTGNTNRGGTASWDLARRWNTKRD